MSLRIIIGRYKSLLILLIILFSLLNLFQLSILSSKIDKEEYSSNLKLNYDTAEIIWSKTWGILSSNDEGEAIALDSSGNVYIVGTLGDDGGDSNIFLTKYSSSGNNVWNATWDNGGNDSGKGIAIDNLGNIYIAGSSFNTSTSNMDTCLIKYNNAGTYLWNRTWDSGYPDFGEGVVIDSSNTFIYIAGYIIKPDQDIVLIKYNSTGTKIWNYTYDNSGFDELCYDIAIDPQNALYLGGSTTQGDVEMYALKTDVDGNTLHEYEWDSFDGHAEIGNAIVVDEDTNYYLLGYEFTDTSNVNAWSVKLNTSGGHLGDFHWGEGTNIVTYGQGNAIDAGNSYNMVGYTNNTGTGEFDIFYMNNGPIGFEFKWNSGGDDKAYDICIDSQNYVYITGTTNNSATNGYYDMIIMKLNIDSDMDDVWDSEELSKFNSNIYEEDTDFDGLSDYEEAYEYKTDLNDEDSDDDGLSDFDEVIQYNTDPNDVDSDDDGLSDFEEIKQYYTDPNDADSDDDGYNDGAEVEQGSDPNDPLSTPLTPVFIIGAIFAFIVFMVWLYRSSTKDDREKKKKDEPKSWFD